MNVAAPDSNYELTRKMNAAQTMFDQAKKAETGSDKIEKIGLMRRCINSLKDHAVKQEGFWSRVWRVILNLFGIVTDYQKVLNQIAVLEAAASDLSNETKLSLLHETKKDDQKKIEGSVEKLNRAFNEVESTITEFKSKAAKITRTGQEYNDLKGDVTIYQKHLKDMEETLHQLNEIYQGDIEAFKHIPQLWEKHAAAQTELKRIANQLADILAPKSIKPASSTKKTTALGGISQGGNTCYLASAMQTMNHIETYRNLFDPSMHPLAQRAKESTASFEERKKIQNAGFAIIQKIQSGTTVKGNEINLLRKACFEHYEQGKRVISSLSGQIDSMETLDRILTVLDYKEPQLSFHFQDIIIDENDYEVINDGKERNPDQFSTLAEVKNYFKNGTIGLSAYDYLKADVTMSTLIKNSWETESLTDYIVKHVSETGEISYRKYNHVERRKSLDVSKNNYPPVMRVTIQQLDGQRATITRPDTLYPSGKEGVGPKYRLAAVIEHMPGHYVAHLKTTGGMLTANDSFVHEKNTANIPGYGYFYVRDDA
jgi:hypothetical protein